MKNGIDALQLRPEFLLYLFSRNAVIWPAMACLPVNRPAGIGSLASAFRPVKQTLVSCLSSQYAHQLALLQRNEILHNAKTHPFYRQ